MRNIFVIGVLCLAASPVWALDKAEDIRACVRKNFPTTSSTQTFQLKTVGRDSSERTLHAEAYWKREDDGKAKVMLSVNSPEDLKGSSYLMLEKETRDDLFMYLPAAGRTKRILGNQTSSPLWGTDFSYEDIKQVQGIFDSGKLVREADGEVAGKKVYVLSFSPDKVEESAYRKLMTYVDQETCVALQTDFYEAGEDPRKRLTIKPEEVKKDGVRWIPYFYEMKDLRDGTHSELRIEKWVLDTNLPDRLFNPKTFQLGR